MKHQVPTTPDGTDAEVKWGVAYADTKPQSDDEVLAFVRTQIGYNTARRQCCQQAMSEREANLLHAVESGLMYGIATDAQAPVPTCAPIPVMHGKLWRTVTDNGAVEYRDSDGALHNEVGPAWLPPAGAGRPVYAWHGQHVDENDLNYLCAACGVYDEDSPLVQNLDKLRASPAAKAIGAAYKAAAADDSQ